MSPYTSDLSQLSWNSDAQNINILVVAATSTYLNGSAMVSIPNLSSIPGFLAPAVSGVSVEWTAEVLGATYQLLETVPLNSSQVSANDNGTFIVP